jgi:hypothetical protein
MEALGFLECKVTTGVFVHPVRDIRVVTHVDDFLVAGENEDIVWLRDEMSKKYELKVQIAGWEPGDEKELSFLGRTITLSYDGVTMEGDDKHVQRLQEEWGMDTCSAVSTPYVKPTQVLEAELAKELNPKEATLFRRAAARVNYVALDRPDLSFASRIAASKMSTPREGDDLIIKRIIRYLQGRPRMAIHYGFQESGQGIVVLTDSDWAGCLETRRSTSGGVVRHGEHTISWWCKLQTGVALSSCEAELNSTLKGAIEGLNIQRLANAFNDWPSLELRTDASAARGVIMRQGVGKGSASACQTTVDSGCSCKRGVDGCQNPQG